MGILAYVRDAAVVKFFMLLVGAPVLRIYTYLSNLSSDYNNNNDFEWVLGLNSPAQSHLSPSGSVQQAVVDSLVEDSDDGLIILLYIGDRGWMWVCR